MLFCYRKRASSLVIHSVAPPPLPSLICLRLKKVVFIRENALKNATLCVDARVGVDVCLLVCVLVFLLVCVCVCVLVCVCVCWCVYWCV